MVAILMPQVLAYINISAYTIYRLSIVCLKAVDRELVNPFKVYL
jgi:hypothetical protein